LLARKRAEGLGGVGVLEYGGVCGWFEVVRGLEEQRRKEWVRSPRLEKQFNPGWLELSRCGGVIGSLV